MKNVINTQNDAFQSFLARQILQTLSGTTVMSFAEISALQSSIIFVLKHAKNGNTFFEQFADGKAQISKKVKEARYLYQKITEVYQSFEIESLEATIKELGGFFSDYDIECRANQEGNIWVDYQLANPVDASQQFGIDYVSEYLEGLY